MDLIYLLRVLLKRKWLILGTGLLAALIAFFATSSLQKKYKSSSRISTGFTVSDDIKVTDNFNLLEAETKFSNIIVTCNSPAFINLLSCRLILHDLTSDKPFRYVSENAKKSSVFTNVNIPQAIKVYKSKLDTQTMLTSYNEEERKLLEFLALYGYDYKGIMGDLSVFRLGRTDYLQIEFSSENPLLSAYAVNETYKQFIEYSGLLRTSKSQQSIDTLYSLMEKKKNELDMKNAFLRSEGLSDASIESSSKFDVIADLEKVLTEERNKLNSLRYDLQKVNARIASSGAPKASAAQDPTNDEIVILKKSMEDAYKDYLNDGSKDKALLEKYYDLKKAYNNKVVNLSSRGEERSSTSGLSRAELADKKMDIQTDIDASSANIAAIENKIGQVNGTIKASSSRGVEAQTLQKEAELANNEYLAAKQKYNDATDISVSSVVNNLRQISIAQPAIEPEPSKRPLIMGMAVAGGVLTTILVLVILTYLDSSIKTPNIFSKVIGLKLISMINFTNLKGRTIKEVVAVLETDENKNKLDNGNKRHNVFRESLRKLRYEVEKSGKKVFLFTSTKKGQGKTTLIQALSYSLSLSNKKILIIDTNFCNNDLTLQMDGAPSFENLVLSKNYDGSVLDKIKQASKEVSDGNVFIIGCEGGDYTPSEVLKGSTILNHLTDLKGEYDYIFLEGPPLNDFTDSKELSMYVESVIAVFSADQIFKQIDKQSLSFFYELKDKFLGAILNKVDLEDVNTA